MLPEVESGLADYFKTTALKGRVRAIDVLPDLDGKTLVDRMAANAPALYVSLANNFVIREGAIHLKAGIACVARNARSPTEARHGDGKQVGMLELVDAALVLIEGHQVAGVSWAAIGLDVMGDDVLMAAGLHVGVIRIESTAPVTLPSAIDLDALPDFMSTNTQYDIEPHASTAEHSKWLQEPPDHSASAPELTDQQQLQP